MRLWVFSFQKKCPVGAVDSNYFINLLETYGISSVSQVSDSTLVFQSRDIHDWKFWNRVAQEHLEKVFYYSILELKNSNCKPVGAVKTKMPLEAAYVLRK
jgi:hypothetical protein